MNTNGLSMRQKARWLVPALAVMTAVAVASDAPAKEKKDGKNKQVIRIKDDGGYLGVYMQELTDDMRKGLNMDASRSGVLISGVEEDSPAAKAGLEDGDVITKVDGKAVDSPDELRAAVRGHEPGTTTSLEVWQDGKSRNLTVTVGERPDQHEMSFFAPDIDVDVTPHIQHAFSMMGGPRLGVEARELDDAGFAAYFGAKPGDGVLVLDVDDESVAGKAGVKAGDVIRQIGEDKVTEVRDIKDAVREFEEGDEFTITVQRNGKAQELKATMDEQSGTWSFRAPRAMRWHNMDVPRTPRTPRAPGMHEMQRGRADMQRQLDDLKDQIEELKEQLERQDG